jgi:GR25 family glycosyltransferase involved in LPS biosynthesis
MIFKDIPKFVINLESRPDRLEDIKFEMNYIGWDYDLFKAVPRNDYMGCALSHLSIIEMAKERGYKRVMVIEDDCVFMPYAKNFIEDLERNINGIDFGVLNLSPTLNRPMNVSEKYSMLLDLTNLPPKPHERLTETFATNILIYDESSFEKIEKIKDKCFYSGDFIIPIDEQLVKHVYPSIQSYAPILPIAPQKNSYSDVSQGMYNNFYAQTYNWNVYSPIKINHRFLNESENKKMKTEKKYLPYNVN